MFDNKLYLNVLDVQNVLGISQSKAYGIIRTLNSELQEKGFLTVQGRVSAAYFNNKLYAVNQ